MAKDKVEKEVILNVTTNADEATLKIDKLTEGVKKNTEATEKNAEAQEDLAKEAKKTEKEVDSLGKTFGDNTLVTKALDTATGGLYSTFKDGIQQVSQLSSGIQSYSSAQKVASTTTKGTISALGGLKTAIIATGIGAFIVIIGTLISKMDILNKVTKIFKVPNVKNLSADFEEVNRKYDKLVEETKKLATKNKISEEELSKSLIKINSDRTEELKKIGANYQKNMLRNQKIGISKLLKGAIAGWSVFHNINEENTSKAIKLEDKIYSNTVGRYKAFWITLLGIESRASKHKKKKAELDKVIDLAILDSEVEGIKLIEEKKEKDRVKREQALQKEKDILQRKRELDTEYAITQEEKFKARLLKNEQENLDNIIKNRVLVGEERDKANKITRDYYNEQKTLIQDQETLWKTFNETFKGDSVATVVNIMDLFKGGEEAVKAFKNTYKEVLDIEEVGEFIQGIETNLDRIKAITDSHNADLLEINRARDIEGVESLKRFKLDELQELEDKNIKELESLSASEDAKLKVYLYYANERTKVEEEASERSKAIQDEKFQNYLKISDGIAGTFDAFAQSSKEAGGLQKGFAIASVIMDTTAGAIETFRGISKSFGNTPWGMALAGVASAGVVANGLSAVNRIKAVKTDGTETGGSATASATMTPNVQFVSSADNQISNTIAEVSPEDTGPIKAYVVSSEVTTSQQLERNAVESSSL